jgi:hypothetical protein
LIRLNLKRISFSKAKHSLEKAENEVSLLFLKMIHKTYIKIELVKDQFTFYWCLWRLRNFGSS